VVGRYVLTAVSSTTWKTSARAPGEIQLTDGIAKLMQAEPCWLTVTRASVMIAVPSWVT
jgi:UTP-glucose-1-phosphate uridylyltransferase